MDIYLDSCVAIYLIEGAESWQAPVQAALRQHARDAIWVSDLVRLECRVGPLRRGEPDLLGEYDRLFRQLLDLPLSRRVFDLAAELRAHRQLRTPDAIHLAAALEHECDEFWTNDTRLDGISPGIVVRVLP